MAAGIKTGGRTTGAVNGFNHVDINFMKPDEIRAINDALENN